jgi:integrase/recombinase XerD
MPLKIVQRGNVKYLRGRIRGERIFETTGTNDKKAAEAIRVKKEARLLADSIHGKEESLTFDEAALSYLDAGGSHRFLGQIVDGRWTGLVGHFYRKVLRKITQEDLENAAETLYPGTQHDTKNRQCFTPFIAIWNRSLPDNPRKWKRPKKPKGTTVARLKPVRAGTKPVEYEAAWEFVRAMSPGPAALMTALFYTGMRPIEMFVLSSEMVNIKNRWITLEHSKIGEPRGIPLHEFLVPLFTPLVERGGILFLSSLGKPYPADDGESGQMKTAILGARRRSGVQGIAPYTARHTVSTQLVVNRVHPHIKDQILGHAVSDMSRHYTNVPQAPLLEAINTLPTVEAWVAAPWMTDPIKYYQDKAAGAGKRNDLIKKEG